MFFFCSEDPISRIAIAIRVLAKVMTTNIIKRSLSIVSATVLPATSISGTFDFCAMTGIERLMVETDSFSLPAVIIAPFLLSRPVSSLSFPFNFSASRNIISKSSSFSERVCWESCLPFSNFDPMSRLSTDIRKALRRTSVALARAPPTGLQLGRWCSLTIQVDRTTPTELTKRRKSK